MSQLPIACNLTTAELHERRGTILKSLRKALLEVHELDNGYAYEFSPTHFKALADMIDLERQCCPFLQFNLTVAAGSGPLQLEVTGPEGTKDFLTNTFEWRRG